MVKATTYKKIEELSDTLDRLLCNADIVNTPELDETISAFQRKMLGWLDTHVIVGVTVQPSRNPRNACDLCAYSCWHEEEDGRLRLYCECPRWTGDNRRQCPEFKPIE